MSLHDVTNVTAATISIFPVDCTLLFSSLSQPTFLCILLLSGVLLVDLFRLELGFCFYQFALNLLCRPISFALAILYGMPFAVILAILCLETPHILVEIGPDQFCVVIKSIP